MFVSAVSKIKDRCECDHMIIGIGSTFISSTPLSSTNKGDRHDNDELMHKV
jgi:hypothetical protein